MNKWDKLHQRILDLAAHHPFDACKSHVEQCENTAYKEALADVAQQMNRLDAEEAKPTLRCCGTIGCPGGITLTCRHAWYAFTSCSRTVDGLVTIQDTSGFRCSAGRDTRWVARDGCDGWEPVKDTTIPDHGGEGPKWFPEASLDDVHKTKPRPCISCWWQEGGRCYCEERGFTRDNEGRSNCMADAVCACFTNKRRVLEQVIPPDMLVIVSELNAEKGDAK